MTLGEHLLLIIRAIPMLIGLGVSMPLIASPMGIGDNRGGAWIVGWEELIETLETLPAEMLDALPPEVRDDPNVQQELARVMLSAISSSTLSSLGGDPRYPEFLPSLGRLMNIGQPNADTIYKTVRVDPTGVYRIYGSKGSVRMLTLSQSVGAKNGQPSPRVFDHDLNAVNADTNGQFEVILSQERPTDYEGHWWALQPSANSLLLRVVSSDWLTEQEPKIAIERLDPLEQPYRQSAVNLQRQLQSLPRAISFVSKLFVGHVYKLRDEGVVNTLRTLDVSQIGGLNSQYYYEGVYQLEDDEALLVETVVPENCLYRSIILTNHLYETTDWYNNHSSLNDSQALPDRDGVLRVVVSLRDPGVPNWLDTAGYPMGVIQGRWVGCKTQPIPSVKKIKVTEARQFLPQDTPLVTSAQRSEIVRQRRAALQKRSKW